MRYNAFSRKRCLRFRGERRYPRDLSVSSTAFAYARWQLLQGFREGVLWCTNGCLGIRQHPKVISTIVEIAIRMGT